MTTKNYLLDASLDCFKAITLLVDAIPCLVRKLEICDSSIEFELTMRNEDVKVAENRLAAYV